MNIWSIFFSIVLFFWIVWGSYLYTCKYWQLCDNWSGKEKTEITAETKEEKETQSGLAIKYQGEDFIIADENFIFDPSAAKPSIPEKTAFVIDSLKSYIKNNPSKKLEITGYYGKEENNKSSFANLGLARADAIKNLIFSPKLHKNEQFATKGELQENPNLKDNKLLGGIAMLLSDLFAKDKTESIPDILSNPPAMNFGFAGTQMQETAETQAYFKALKDFLDKNPDSKINITGHTDNIGSPERNMEFGKNRAESVKNNLLRMQVKAEQILTDSKGLTEPIADNGSEEGRLKNRRVEISIQK